MAVLAAAQLLDELMGRHRNVNPNEKLKKPNWADQEYCKYYMVKFCPHDLFVNTRADLGVCPKVHDDEVKDLFDKAESDYKKTQYIEEFLRFCRSMINDVERKITKGKQRLELMNTKPEAPPMTQAQTEKNQEQLKMLGEKVQSLEREAEEAGTRGDVEQAQGLMKLCDRLKEEREQLLKQAENSHWSITAELAAAQEKQMEVCPVCGAFLIVGDAQQRIDDHLTGKQHVGYYKLRQAYDEMVLARDAEAEEKDRRRREERAARGGLGRNERERPERNDRDRERERSDRDRERSEKDRERSDKDRDRSDKDKERSEKDKDRSDKDRERSDKDRERPDKDKERSEKDRERSDKDRGERDRSDRDRRSHRSSREERNGARHEDRDRDRRHRNDKSGRTSHESSRRHRSRSRDRR